MTRKGPVFVFVSGGVISGLGKGITTASVALLLQSAGFRVTVMKVDMYLNVDAGTMNPLEHGEVFVTHDGLETDQDIGHYERFLNQNLTKDNYLTAGQVYLRVIEKERSLFYDGRCVEAYLHIPAEIISCWEKLGRRADFVLIEMGGTVGEYQNVLFFEAARRLKIKYPERVIFIHVVYLPVPRSIGEMKSKPAQQSVGYLNALGISPDFIICRAEKEVDVPRRRKIALAAAIPEERIFSAPDVDSIYRVPVIFKEQGLDKSLLKLVGRKRVRNDLKEWRRQLRRMDQPRGKVKIAMVGKYYRSGRFSLEDAYVSVVEAIKQAAWFYRLKPEIVWIDSEQVEKEGVSSLLKGVEGVVVPGGFGRRGVEGKIRAIGWARENKVPFLGLCYGMQLATVEFARRVVGLRGADSTEINPKTVHPVIHLMPDQEKRMLSRDYGGTMRLGAWPCWLRGKSLSGRLYAQFGWTGKRGKRIVWERHRHRWEFNNRYRKKLEEKGLLVAGTTPDDKIVEVIELPQKDHPFFVGVQFHPEFQSRFLRPHPLFLGLIKAAVNYQKERRLG